MDDLGWFWGGDDWYDRRLRRNAHSIEGAVMHRPGEASPSTGRVSQHQGSVEHRLGVLSARVAELTELVDVRAQLATYLPAAIVRWNARRRIASWVGGAQALSNVDDVAGYWLAPALEALAELIGGGAGGAAARQAGLRDPVRTPLFLALSLAVTGRVEQTSPILRQLLALPATLAAPPSHVLANGSGANGASASGSPEPDARPIPVKLTHAARLAWIATAEGHLGARALDELPGALGMLLGSPERDDGLAHWVATAGTIPQPRRSNDWAEVPLRAAARLAVLDGWCAESAPAVPAPAAMEAKGREPITAITDLLRFVIEEGSPAEMALRQRDRRLSDAIRGREYVANVRLDEELASISELLAADAFGPHPVLRTLALRAGDAWVIQAADALRREAHLPPSSYLSLQIGRTSFKVTSTGVLPEDLTAAVQVAIGPEPTSLNPITRHRENVVRDAYAVETRNRYESAIEKAVRSLVEWHATCAAAAAEADRLFESIRTRLGGTASEREPSDTVDGVQRSDPSTHADDAAASSDASEPAIESLPPLGSEAGPPSAESADRETARNEVSALADAAGPNDSASADGAVAPANGVVPVAIAPVVVAAIEVQDPAGSAEDGITVPGATPEDRVE